MENTNKTTAPATDKLLDLYKLIKSNYGGILSKRDMSDIYFIIGNRLHQILEEEKEYAKELESDYKGE